MEDQEAYSDDSLFNISSWGADLTFRELVQMYADGDLIRPEFQRNYVWTKAEAGRFIESILLGLPVPSIFLANAANKQKLIIDGYQRIMTVHDYMVKKKFANEEVIFRLPNTVKINARWRNRSFDELRPEDQRQLRSSTIHAIIFEQRQPKDDDTSMFQIFSRINTSGKPLNAQEIRNCVCQGSFNKMLFELNEYPKWRELYGALQPNERMQDIELILRYFAIEDLEQMESGKKQINLRKYLDIYMQKRANVDVSVYRDKFLKMIDFVYDKLGKDAFVNLSTSQRVAARSTRRINPIVFESIAVASTWYLQFGHTGESLDLQARKMALLSNEDYVIAATKRTTNMANIEKRIQVAKAVLFDG